MSRIDGLETLRMVKKPALLETHFAISQSGATAARVQEHARAPIGLMMITLLERSRE